MKDIVKVISVQKTSVQVFLVNQETTLWYFEEEKLCCLKLLMGLGTLAVANVTDCVPVQNNMQQITTVIKS